MAAKIQAGRRVAVMYRLSDGRLRSDSLSSLWEDAGDHGQLRGFARVVVDRNAFATRRGLDAGGAGKRALAHPDGVDVHLADAHLVAGAGLGVSLGATHEEHRFVGRDGD